VHDASRRPIRPGVRAFAVDLEKSIPGSLVCNTCNPRGFPAMGRAILSSPREAGDGSYFSSMNSAGLCRSRCVGSRAVVAKCAGPPCAKGLCAAHVGARHCYAMSFAGAVTASQK